jgi:hypothetical protein
MSRPSSRAGVVLEEARAQVRTDKPLAAQKSPQIKAHHLAPQSNQDMQQSPAHALSTEQIKIKQMYQGSLNRIAERTQVVSSILDDVLVQKKDMEDKLLQARHRREEMVRQAAEEDEEFEREFASLRLDFETKMKAIKDEQEIYFEDLEKRHHERMNKGTHNANKDIPSTYQTERSAQIPATVAKRSGRPQASTNSCPRLAQS